MEFNPETTYINMNETITNIYLEINKMKEKIAEQEKQISDQEQKISEQQTQITEQEKQIDLQTKQISFIKKLVGTVSNVFQTKQIPDLPSVPKEPIISPKEQPKKLRKSNKEFYKLPDDIISCYTCNIKMRRDALKRHEKTKTHLKQLELKN
jgi:hypothetical protein